MTYTYANLEISGAAYDEIAAKLKAAGYQDVITKEGNIDMQGVHLARAAENASGNEPA